MKNTIKKWSLFARLACLTLTFYPFSSTAVNNLEKSLSSAENNKYGHSAKKKKENKSIHGMNAGLHKSTIISPDDPFLVTHTDRVPNFAQKYTAINLSGGSWSNPNIWRDKRIPQDGDIIRISKNTKVTYDLASDTRIDAIGVAGQLDFSTNISTRLHVTNLLVYPDGKLQIGSSDNPINPDHSAEIIINDHPLDTGTVENPGSDPAQYANGVLIWGTIILHGSPLSPTFLRLAEEPQKGSKELILSNKPEGWRVGDRALLPDSRQTPADRNMSEQKRYDKKKTSKEGISEPMWETVKIAQIYGNKLQLTTPIRFHHPGATNLKGAHEVLDTGIRLLPHLANISRNIIIRSENPNGIRGHTICFRNAIVDISNTLFKNLGRTTVEKLDNTIFDTENTVLSIGTNQIARYPVHMHHHTDPKGVTGTRYEYRLSGNVIETAPRWGLVIHSTHFGLVKDNIVFNAAGAGIATEDGSETGNHFEHNFIAGIRGSGESVNSRSPDEGLGHEGSGFWLGSDNNILINNVVADSHDAGFTLFRSKASLSYPEFPGLASTLLPDNIPAAKKEKWFKFENNEVYGSSGHGIELWDDKKRKFTKNGVLKIINTLIWHSTNGVNFDYHADNYEIEGLMVRGDPKKLKNTSGVLANMSRKATIRNADIRNVGTGIEGGGARNRQLTIENTNISANTGIRIFRGSGWGKRQPLQIINSKISVLSISPSGQKGNLIELKTESNYKRPASPIIHRPILVSNFQGKPGQDFQIFYNDQSADFVMPKHKDKLKGCPDAGLSNSQCLQRYGIVMGGELANCNQTTEGINGFICPLENEKIEQ